MLPLLPDKPKFAEPCNGCGKCCAQQLCPIGEMAFGVNAPLPCPGLIMSEDFRRVRCIFVLAEIELEAEPLIQQALGIGAGCTMDD